MVLTILLAMWVVLLTLAVLYLFFWLDMLINAINHPFPNNKDKYIWLAILATFIGAIPYYYQVKKLSSRT
jgi:uncharacterized membrane protein